MLQSFNDRLKGPFTWIIVISISFIFVITGMSFFFTNIGSSRAYIAKVGNNEITTQQFQQYAQNATTKQQKQEVLEQMISQYLILADSERHDITVSKLALQSAIFSNPMFFDDGKFSSDKLKQVATYVGGIANLERMLSQNIKASIIPNAIDSTAFITEHESDVLTKLYSISKDIQYIEISPESLQAQIKPTVENLQKYYDLHKAQYMTPAQMNVSYFIVSKDDFKSKEDISEKQIKDYYDTNKDLFTRYDDKTKDIIKKIIQNRQALEEYNRFTQTIDSLKFSELEKKLGKAKTADIKDNTSSDIQGVSNNLFFINNNKYANIAISEDKNLVYQVNNQKKPTQENFNAVKDKLTQAYKLEKSQSLATQEANKLLTNLDESKKVQQSFEKATVSSDSDDLPKSFTEYVMLNGNNDYHNYKTSDGNIYVYKVIKVNPLDKKVTLPNEVTNTYKQEELNFYLETIKNEIPVKVNYKNLDE